MSLINKMLQDLDARGGKNAGARDATGDVRPVAAERTSGRAIAIGAAVGVLIVATGAATWHYLNRAAPQPLRPVALAPATPVARAVAPVPVAAAPAAVPAAEPVAPVVPVPPAGVSAEPAMPAEAVPPAEAEVPKTRPPRAARPPAATGADVAQPARAGAPSATTLTPRQQGENAYRRALAALQDGRVTEALAVLEGTVQADPRHEAARQTLVGLLLENGRPEEAMRHAQLGLTLDANQPQLAMVLARLQLERGGAADETLLRTLPHAAGNADYIAFLAGVLQKQGRHGQAVEQYRAALQLQPANGVWWMGLGMSLQADNLRTDARDAFHKAQAAGLAPELHAFVERRLAQLR